IRILRCRWGMTSSWAISDVKLKNKVGNSDHDANCQGIPLLRYRCVGMGFSRNKRRRTELSDAPRHGRDPIRGRKRQRRCEPNHLRRVVEDHVAAHHRRQSPGAGGNTGTAAAARATPDGYTLLGAASGPLAANATLYANLGYDPERDLEMITPFAAFTIVVVASTKLPVNSLSGLIGYAKANPGKLNYGSVGIGSSQHLAGEYFAQLTDVKITHVPYRNIGQYAPDLMSGAVPLGFQWFPNVAAPIQAKGALALAVAGEQRLAALPDVPTAEQAGLP